MNNGEFFASNRPRSAARGAELLHAALLPFYARRRSHIARVNLLCLSLRFAARLIGSDVLRVTKQTMARSLLSLCLLPLALLLLLSPRRHENRRQRITTRWTISRATIPPACCEHISAIDAELHGRDEASHLNPPCPQRVVVSLPPLPLLHTFARPGTVA